MLSIVINADSWLLENTCPAPLLTIWLFPDGLDGASEEVASGSELCAQPAPWSLAVAAPPASYYEVLVFDFVTPAVNEYDEISLPQQPDGLVVLPAAPAEGRTELNLLDESGMEMENVSVYYDCP